MSAQPKRYPVVEIFNTLQGEGSFAGHRAVFLRLAGCNVWSGYEKDRERDANKGDCARWCDTVFVGGTMQTVDEIVARMDQLWGSGAHRRVVVTGGEPLLHDLDDLFDRLHSDGWALHMESNGTQPLGDAGDYPLHLCVSPKHGTVLCAATLAAASELKVVWPGGWTVADLDTLSAMVGEDAELFLQPQDPCKELGASLVQNIIRQKRTNEIATICAAASGRWRVGVQLHKILGLA